MNTIVNFFEWINPALWVIANLCLIYIGITLILFVVLYQVFFDPRATTGGRMIFRFALSLSFVVAIIVLGLFVDPRHDLPWYLYPIDTSWWRPAARVVAYGYVAYTISALVWFLYHRKFHPEKLRRAPDRMLVTPRHNTAEVDVIEENKHD